MPKIKSRSQYAFFSPPALIGFLPCLGGFTLAFYTFRTASAQSPAQATPIRGTPASRNYPGIVNDQTGQNYNAVVFGDVAATYVH